jgi:hypothetical protein
MAERAAIPVIAAIAVIAAVAVIVVATAARGG